MEEVRRMRRDRERERKREIYRERGRKLGFGCN